MEKSVYNMKAEKIQKQVKQGDFVTAAKICDTIDWTQVRSARMLSLVSSVYEHVGKYDTAIDILLMAYEEAPVGRRFLFKLTELALAAGNIREAEEYYKNYIQEAADDSSRYILRYKIAKKKNEPIEKRISILSTYKQMEFDEQWATELAKLLDEAGETEKCLALCDEIILWFGVGNYVNQCKEIKAKYAPSPSYIYEETPAPAAQKAEEKAPTSIPDAVAISGMAAESGQQVSALDMSVINAEDNEPATYEGEEEESFANTRRIVAKDDFSRTRIFDKLPVNTSELKLFKTVTAGESEETANENKEGREMASSKEIEAPSFEKSEQMELTWDDDLAAEPKEIKMVVFIGTDSPNEALELSVEKIKEVHKSVGSPIAGITKIAGPKLNTKGLISSLEALANKDVIIMGASRLSDEVLLELKEITEKIDTKKVFVLADSKEGAIKTEERYENVKAPEEEEAVIEEFEPVEKEPEEEEPEIEIAEFEPEIIIPEEEAKAETPVVQDFKEAEEEVNLEEVTEDVLEEPKAEEPEEEVIEEPASKEDILEKESPSTDERAFETDVLKPGTMEVDTSDYRNERSLSAEEFLQCVLDYCKEIDCVLEKGADKELLRYFEELREDGEPLDKQLAEDMVEDAANASEKKTFGNLFHTRYTKDGLLILRATHFV